MAQLDQVVSVEGKLDDTRLLVDKSTSTTNESSDFFTAKGEPSRSSSMDSIGCKSDAAPSSSEQFLNVESEIEASKVHWTEVQLDSDEEGSAVGNTEVYRTLRRQYGTGLTSFFMDLNVGERVGLGEKIAEGGQAEIFELRFVSPEYANWNHAMAAKVFKMEGWTLQDIQKQWSPAMLQKASTLGDGFYHCASEPGYTAVLGGMMFNEGRVAFWMNRYWGDLRKLIDIRMQHNGNQAPPFTLQRRSCIPLQKE